MIAALYVRKNGPYIGRDGIDPWTIERDARLYSGPHPVVAHPPCERWGRYWSGGPSAKERKTLGDDGGCFEHALMMVRRYGGVLEHPEASKAWDAYRLMRPPKTGGWVSAGMWDHGWTCCVEQGHYGHAARKATWLYVCRVPDLPVLKWGASEYRKKLDQGFHTAEERRRHWDPKWQRWRQKEHWDRMSRKEREETPEPFVELLIDIAKRVR